MSNLDIQTTLNKGEVAKYESQYGDYIDITAEAMKQKYEHEWTSDDTVAFGRYASTWEDYRDVFESDMTARNVLGPALDSNLGLIAMAYAALPIQNFASIQPLSDEAGTVNYRHAVAANSRGDIVTGDELITPYGVVNPELSTFVSETQIKTQKFVAGTDTYNFNTYKELVPGDLKVNIEGGKVKGFDDGEGHIVGVGILAEESTVDYSTGAVVLKLSSQAMGRLTANSNIDLCVTQSTVAADEIPTMKWILDTKVVKVEYDVLQSQYSNIAEMVLKKRFGADLADKITADLVTQMASATMWKAIRKLREAAIRNEIKTGRQITWSMASSSGVSDFDHRRTFDDKIIDAVDMMIRVAGKGEISTLVVGKKGKQVLRTAGMRMIRNAVSGPHLCGMYDTVPVYYSPSVITDSEILVIYRGTDWNESPLVYAPFLPITTVSGNAVGNVLTNAQAAYHASALENVVDGFVARITII